MEPNQNTDASQLSEPNLPVPTNTQQTTNTSQPVLSSNLPSQPLTQLTPQVESAPPSQVISSPLEQKVKEKPSVKIQIVGFLIIISSTIMIFAFLLSMLMVFSDGSTRSLLPGLLALAFGVFGIIVGSGIRSLEKWTWYAGTITLGLALVGNLISLGINFELFLILPILIEIFSLYSLISEKGAFLSQTR